MFEYADSSLGPYLIPELQTSVIRLTVTRRGGLYGTASLNFQIVPNGTEQFDGATTTILFNEGETSKTVAFAPKDDDIPELAQTFTAMLTARSTARMGNHTNVTVTIDRNDDATGVFGLSSVAPLSVREPKSAATTVSFTILRTRGLFESVNVPWRVVLCNPSVSDCFSDANVASASADIGVTSGTVDFVQNQSSATFTTSVLPDDLPESDEVFVVQLLTPTNTARVDSSLAQVALTVPANDDPVQFAVALTTVEEADKQVVLTVIRGGQATSNTSVSYVTSGELNICFFFFFKVI